MSCTCAKSTGGPHNTVGNLWGVPRFVLGPLLWNVAFDVVFQLPMPKGTTAIGYADDTLIVAKDDSVDAMQEHANVALEAVVDNIQGLRLCLTMKKTQEVHEASRGARNALYSFRGRPST